tara:strand:+ start:2575 stop:3393 length:819 start_codon:yes stop_codon:yes gene_type:complete
VLNFKIKTNLEPFIDWFSYTLKFQDGFNYESFVKHISIYNPEIIKSGLVKLDDINLVNREEYLKLEFSGSFFKKPKAIQNLTEVAKWLDWFYKIPDLNVFFDKSTISRIDLSANDYNNTFENKFFILTKRKQEVTRFYRNNNILKGICIGKRGKNFVWYKCYDKRVDTKSAREKAIERFGTCNFIRHEYEIGRKFLREKNIGFKTNFKELFFYLFDTKRVDFNYDSERNKKVFHNVMRKNNDKSALIKQVVGIVRNNLMDVRKEVVERINAI